MASEARMVLGSINLPAGRSSGRDGIGATRRESATRDRATDAAGTRTALMGVAGEGLRNTLALIGGYSQSLIHLALDDETRRRCVDGLLAASDSLAELTDRILELSVAGDGGPVLRPRPVAMDWLVGRLERPMAPTSDKSALQYRATPGLPLVDVDPLWVGHVVRILVAHVRRQVVGGASAVTILAHESADSVILSIRGEAIGAETRPAGRAAERREDPAFDAPAPEDDSEVDLALCRWILEANGGGIWLEEGHGRAAIGMRLPAHRIATWAPVGTRPAVLPTR